MVVITDYSKLTKHTKADIEICGELKLKMSLNDNRLSEEQEAQYRKGGNGFSCME